MDQVINFRTDTNQVTPAAASAAASLQKIKAEQDQLNAAFQRGAVNLTTYKSAMAGLTKDAATAEKAIDKANKAIDPAGGAAAKGGTGKGGRGLLYFGQAVQDFEAAGMRGITNQIDQMAMALGIGAGLAGALTIAGVAIQVFLPQIQAFLAQFKGEDLTAFAGHLQGVSARVKELQEKAATGAATAPELLELRSKEAEEKRLKEGGAFHEAFQAERTPEEKALGEAALAPLKTKEGREAEAELVRLRSQPGASTTAQGLQKEIDEIDATMRKFGGGKGVQALGGPLTGFLQRQMGMEGLEGRKATLQQELKAADVLAEETAGQEVGALFKAAGGGDVGKMMALGDELERGGFGDMAEKVRAEARGQMLAQGPSIDAEGRKRALAEGKVIDAEEKAARDQVTGELEATGKIYEARGEWEKGFDEKMDQFDVKQVGDWAELDKKLKKVGDTALTKEATLAARDQMKDFQRDPRIFGGFEQFFASVQQAGGDRSSERDLLEDLVEYNKLAYQLAVKQAGSGEDTNFPSFN